ncbi:MAG: hypothetical protein ACJ0GF_01465 [Burkholderiales bacterium]|nr:MAG: hypothetical protein CBB82_00955 [Betaproteobacteria bacterium TMED22]
MRLLFLAIVSFTLMAPTVAMSRPVSYPGGWTVMTMHEGLRNSAHVHYSPTAKTSLGYRFEYWPDKELTVHAFQINKLLKRWNKTESQANFYLKSGIGVSYSDFGQFDNKSGSSVFTGLAVDWEDRRRFISYENRLTEIDGIDDFFQQSTRIGWAPYQGDYGDLHTWLMLQIEHMSEADQDYTVTPLIRLFKDVHLIELGLNNHNKFLFNYVFRY